MFIKSPVLCCGENITFHQVAKFSVPLQEPLHAFRMACSSLFCTQRLLLKNGKVTYPLLVHKSPDVY
ncbi:hypothetical protein AWE19_16435 [Escherichia coli]|nr:hypothetical protein [Escherichia coli]EFN8198712.1 hypothetical protein [Escherichia coli]PDO13955.1 hypothetical protein AWE19_16435 [Escherichia coli]